MSRTKRRKISMRLRRREAETDWRSVLSTMRRTALSFKSDISASAFQDGCVCSTPLVGAQAGKYGFSGRLRLTFHGEVAHGIPHPFTFGLGAALASSCCTGKYAWRRTTSGPPCLVFHRDRALTASA